MNVLKKSLRQTEFIYRSLLRSTKLLPSVRNEHHQHYRRSTRTKKIVISSVTAGFLGLHFLRSKNNKRGGSGDDPVGTYKQGLPVYSADEVSKHNTKEKQIWVTYKEGVYDITDYVDLHPAGPQILEASGGSLEPFWMLYTVHHKKDVYDILESCRIGNLRKEDVSGGITDPYAKEPTRHPLLLPGSTKPFNGECAAPLLLESFITSSHIFYVRNHLPVPDIDPQTYKLTVEVEGKSKTLTFTLDDLKKMPKQTVVATLMCAGNRRGEMSKVKTINLLNWNQAGISNAEWTGVPLREILRLAGVTEDDDYKHVQFEAFDFDSAGNHYGGSIPIFKALDKRGDVLLAYEMNGKPLLPDHGFPLRVFIPGSAGARSVKWLDKIIVSHRESQTQWYRTVYKGFSPSVGPDTANFDKAPAIQEVPVMSAICQPSEGDTVKVVDGHITVKGYAWSGGGRKIIRVDVTGNAGKIWLDGEFDQQSTVEPPHHWSWTLWSVKIPVEKGQKTMEIWVKAVDSAYNTQPESFVHIWNFRGLLCNAYHRIRVNLSR